MVARRSTQPRELVRLSPLQFSLSISIVVILLAGAGLAGYFYGLGQAARTAAERAADLANEEKRESDRVVEGPDASVTFYSALTEPRQDPPAPPPSPPSQPVKPFTKPVEVKPVIPSASVSETRDIVPGSGPVLLQVASYKDQALAKKLLKELSSDGYSGTVAKADLAERGVWYRVRIGPYSSENDARKTLDTLREERKLKGYIVK